MLRKRRIGLLLLLIMIAGNSGAYAQERPDEREIDEREKKEAEAQGLLLAPGRAMPLFSGRHNFNFTIAMYFDGIRWENSVYEHQYLRRSINQKNTSAMYFPFSGMDWISEDSSLSVGYETEWFGGKYSFNRYNITSFGAVQGWVKFGRPDFYLKITAGNDNDFTFADSLGADPGLRVYTGEQGNRWKDYADTDNITGGSGIGFRGVRNALTFDLAASEFSITPRKTQTPKPGTVNEYGDVDDIRFRYGARLGYRLGDLGVINASYSMEYKKTGNWYSWDPVTGELAPQSPEAEVCNHYYGLFCMIAPANQFELVLGYSGIATAYLDEYFSVEGNLQTTYPLVLKQAANLNFRYSGLLDGRLRLRNDNSMTLYKDKNYGVFDVTGANWGANYNPTSIGKNYAEVQHFFLWNGLGAEFDLARHDNGRRMMLSLYARNLYRRDIAVSNPLIAEQEYEITRNEFFADLQAKYFFNGRAMVFAGLRAEYYTIFRSKDLNGQNVNFFLNDMIMPRDALETTDARLTLSIPMGFILSW